MKEYSFTISVSVLAEDHEEAKEEAVKRIKEGAEGYDFIVETEGEYEVE